MTIKDTSKFGEWRFSLINPENNQEFSLPIGGGKAKSIQELTGLVVAQMDEFDRITGGEYTKKAREEAAKKNKSFPAYVNLMIHHQLCVRYNPSMPGLCYSNGLGDNIHTMFKGLDKVIEKMPHLVRSAAAAVTKRITNGEVKLGGCQSCGGTRSFNPKKNNLGRAGKLNKK